MLAPKVLITAGPTHEPIDPVRYIANRSSGKMAYALAAVAKDLGYRVVLISGPVSLEAPLGVCLICVNTALEMFDAVQKHIHDCAIFIGAAAVADYRVQNYQDKKIAKQDALFELTLVQNPDIIAWVAQQEINTFVVGFAAQTEDVLSKAQQKMQRKKLDMIIANDVSQADIGFGSECNQVYIIKKDQSYERSKISPKIDLARDIWQHIKQQYQSCYSGKSVECQDTL